MSEERACTSGGAAEPAEESAPAPVLYATPGRVARAGDVVLVQQSRDKLIPLRLESGQSFSSHLGCFPHDKFIGAPFGTKIYSLDDKGFLFMFRLDPLLWTRAIKCRTQVLFTPDVSQIINGCDLAPGDTVVEAGTGSGILSHFIAAAIAPGTLYTFELNDERRRAAQAEFAEHGLRNVVCATRNAYDDGFVPDELRDAACAFGCEALFLDVPEPWRAVDHVLRVLREGGVFATFSPCIEQTQRLIAAVRATGQFSDFRTTEMLYKVHEVPRPVLEEPKLFREQLKPRGKRKPAAFQHARREGPTTYPLVRPASAVRTHTGYLTFCRKIGSAAEE